MKLGIGFFGELSIRQMIHCSIEAERCGFDSLWIADHYLLREVSAASAAILGSTNRITIGIGTLNPYTRHPAVVAMAAATLQEYAPGRIILGVGAGVRHKDALLGEVKGSDLIAMEECVMTVRHLLKGETVSFRGKTMNVKGIKLGFSHGEQTIPIYIGAMGPKMLELSGSMADGVLLSAGAVTRYIEEARSRVAVGARRVDRDPSEVPVSSYVLLSMDQDEERARNYARNLVATFIAQPFFKPIVELSGVSNDEVLAVREAWVRGGTQEAREVVSKETIETFAIAGNPKECRRRMLDFVKTGVDELILVPCGPDLMDVTLSSMEIAAWRDDWPSDSRQKA